MQPFDEKVRGSLDLAQTEALKRKNSELSQWHLLHGLLNNPKTSASRAFKDLRPVVKGELEKLATQKTAPELDRLRATSKLSEWITYASSDAISGGREEVSERDLLKAMPKIFPDLPVNYASLSESDAQAEKLERPTFLVNLNELAQVGKLDPVIGRDKEIRSVMEILGRRGKNNPVLVGPAGVGKTAIVEGLALAIYKGNVPDVLKGKEVFALDLGALMAGTKFRGEFEERMQGLMKYLKEQDGQAILFIDEIHQLVGAGRTDGAMDAANLLKPALARGDLHCIGATTEDEYQKYIMKDSALERRFRAVPVKEPSTQDAIEILMGVKEKFEIHHGIKISADAIYSAVMLSTQYITDKNLPDKAIDLIDEAASAVKLSAEAMPPHLVELESEIRSKSTLSKVEKENKEILHDIEKLKQQFTIEKTKWESEVLSVKRLSELKNKLDRLRFDLEQAERKQDFDRASEIKYGLMPEIEKELASANHDWILSKKDIAQVISRQTGVPLEKILKTQQENILGLEDYLNKRVLGQENSLHEVAGTLISSHAGLSDETRPMGSFLLLGPSGVGKTETAKAVTQYLFGSERNLIRIDLSEYSEKHSVAKLIGAPAGYVGYDEGGILTEAVRRNPYSVILFDEMEKAHEDFGDILLQIMDDGRLTDNRGRTINFKNCTIFLTSNAKDYKRQFKPEVLGRLDAILTYNPLEKTVHKQLVQKQVDLLNDRLSGKNLKVELDESLLKELMDRGFDTDFGARPLASTFQKIVARPLSRILLEGKLPHGNIKASWKGHDVHFAP